AACLPQAATRAGSAAADPQEISSAARPPAPDCRHRPIAALQPVAPSYLRHKAAWQLLLAKLGKLRTEAQQGLAVDLRDATFADAQQFGNDCETDILGIMLPQDECLALGKRVDLLPKAVLHFPQGEAVICGRRGVGDRFGALSALVEHDAENQRCGKA